jgi:hypothetical protein
VHHVKLDSHLRKLSRKARGRRHAEEAAETAHPRDRNAIDQRLEGGSTVAADQDLAVNVCRWQKALSDVLHDGFDAANPWGVQLVDLQDAHITTLSGRVFKVYHFRLSGPLARAWSRSISL